MKQKIFIAAAILSSSQLLAQDSASLLNEVIFTANKFLQKQDQTGKVISVITREELEKKGGRTLAQILNEQAGITINGALNVLGSNQTLYVRGASAGRTLVLLDGIPVYDPTLINSEFDLNFLMTNDIERIEILRGAQSTLYGSDAVAGTINIITVKKDVDKKVNVKATVTGGNYNTFRENAQVYGKIKKLTYSTKFAHLSSKGFSSAYDSSGTMGFEKDGYKGTLLNAALQYQFTPQFSLCSFIQNSNYTSDVDEALFTDDKDYTIENRSLISGAGFQFKNNALTLTGNYQYSETKRGYLNDSMYVGGFSKYTKDDYFGKAQFAELYGAINMGKNFTFLQGGDYRFSSMNNQFLSISNFGPYADEFKDTTMSQASLYASLLFKSTNEKLNVELGGRLNVHSRYGHNSTYTFNPSYQLNGHFRAFGSIATGFKAPTLYQLYSSFVGSPDLKPEKSVTYELGVQQKHNKFSNRLVCFYRGINDGLDFDYNTFKYFNFIKQLVRGIELESVIKPTGQMNISFNYTYLSSSERTQSRKSFVDTTYDHLLRRPAHSFNLSVGYQLTEAAYVSLGGKYAGKRFDSGGFMEGDIELDRYFILGAYTEYKFKKHFKVFADVQNFTNKKFFDIRGYNSIPFIINGGITFNW